MATLPGLGQGCDSRGTHAYPDLGQAGAVEPKARPWPRVPWPSSSTRGRCARHRDALPGSVLMAGRKDLAGFLVCYLLRAYSCRPTVVWSLMDAGAAAWGGGPPDWSLQQASCGGDGYIFWTVWTAGDVSWVILVSAVPRRRRFPDHDLEALFGDDISSLGVGWCSRFGGVTRLRGSRRKPCAPVLVTAMPEGVASLLGALLWCFSLSRASLTLAWVGALVSYSFKRSALVCLARSASVHM